MVNTYKQDEEKTSFSWSNFTRIMEFIKPYKGKLIFAFFLGLLSNILILFIPKIMAYAIDVSFLKQDFLEIVYLTLIMVGLVLLSVLFMKIKRDKMLIVLDSVSHDLKIAIFTKLQYLPHSFFDTRSHGKIYTRATTYPDDASSILCYVFLEVITDFISLVFVLIFMLTTHVFLSLISIVISGLLFIVFICLSPLRRRLKHLINNKNSNINAYVSESIHGVKITQSFNREKKNESILAELENERTSVIKKTFLLGNLNWALTGMFSIICMALVYYVGFQYFYPGVTLGIILAVDSYSSRFWDPISYLMNSYEEITEASVYLERIFELLDEDIQIKNRNHARKLDISGDIEFRDVSFSYDGKRNVLENFHLSVQKGQKIGLVGETGSGKSTILSLISRFYDVTDGAIFIDGVDIRDIRLDSLRGQVSVMLQDNFLFARSVYDNLVLDQKIPLSQVIQVCESLDIHGMILNMEQGYDTILFNNGSNLSSGERQLLCIARIMIQNPKILILDEATSNIDLKTEEKISKALDIVTKNRTTILVAHRISTIRNCDKIVLIKDQSAFEEGTHQELMKKRGAYYKLYTSQSLE